MTHEFVNSLPFHLNRVGVKLGDLFGAQLAAHAFTVPMYRALAVLRQEGPKSLTELSQLTNVELSTLSRLVSGLVKRGLILRKRPEENGRIVQIELTPEGEVLIAKLMPIAIEYEQLAIRGFSEAEVEDLKRLLRLIYRNLEIGPHPGEDGPV